MYTFVLHFISFFFLQVNNETRTPPYKSGNIEITLSGHSYMVMTECGVFVEYDRSHQVMVHVPTQFGNDLTGMCGNCKLNTTVH